MIQTPQYLEWEQKNYNRLVQWRDKLFQPLLPVLSKLKVTPTMLSAGGIGLMFVFMFVLLINPVLAVVVGGISLLLDFIDGPLARHQGTASDKGKLIDVVADNTSFIFYMIGVTAAGLLEISLAAVIVGGVVLAKILGIVKNKAYLKSDWYFRAAAGFIPSLVVGLCYVFLLPAVFMSLNYFTVLSGVVGVLLSIDIWFSLINIIKKI